MKALLLALTIALSISTVQANPAIALGFIVFSNMAVSSEVKNAGLFKTVLVAHADNPKGYSFDVTQYELDQNPAAYKVK